jgi:acyl transferase domain-containing protein
VAFTLAVGRRQFEHRRAVVCRNPGQAIAALRDPHSPLLLSSVYDGVQRSIVFMFPGLGEQYVGMASGLYEQEPTFRAEVDHCAEVLKEHLGLDLREVLFRDKERGGDEGGEKTAKPSGVGGFDLRKMLKRDAGQGDEATRKLNQTFLTQPIVFVIEYALSKLWMEWGIKPQAMIGYSIGEYVAACLADVMSLEDALSLVARRAAMIEALPAGAMLAVPLPEDEVSALLGSELSLAAVNGPSLCVVAGPREAVADLKGQLAGREVICSELQTSHAFHSRMMQPIADSFIELVKTIQLRAPRIPYLSNVTGTWITAEQATDPEYYARHLCQAVRFADGLKELWQEPRRIFLEVGPGQTLGSLALQHPSGLKVSERIVVPTLPSAYDRQPDTAFLLNSLALLWLGGAEIDWSGFYAHERRRRVSLPTYPFERQRYFIERKDPLRITFQSHTKLSKRPDAADWFYAPSWKRSTRSGLTKDERQGDAAHRWLTFIDKCGVGARLAEHLGREHEVVTVTPGEEFARIGAQAFAINPREPADYVRLLKDLADSNKAPDRIVHLWNVTRDDPAPDGSASDRIEWFEAAQERGFYSLLYLTQALGAQNFVDPLHVTVLTNNAQEVTGEEALDPEKATLFGLCKVIPQEYANITCRVIDVALSEGQATPSRELLSQLLSDLDAKPANEMLAYRGRHRWEQTFEPVRLDQDTKRASPLRRGGVYLIVGGLGQIGRALAEHFARNVQAKLVLTGRTEIPARAEWEAWLQTHDATDDVSARIEALQNIEALGAEVLVLRADATDEREMRRVIAQTRARFGDLDGVIYAAGTTGSRAFRALPETGRAECAWHFQSKAHGLYVLENVLRGQRLDFCLLFSSLSSVLGGLGFAAYASANAFMDIFAHEHNRKGDAHWRCADWDTWLVDERREQRSDVTSNLSALVMNGAEGVEAFLRIISAKDATRVVVSLADLDTRIEQWIKHEPERGDSPAEEAAVSLHRRPALRNDYVAPRNEVEATLADIWQEVLGIEQVGIYDNFFQLGGHSLLGTQVISRVRKTFMIDMPVRTIFDAHNVADLAEAIILKRAQQLDSETLEQLLAGLKESPEEGLAPHLAVTERQLTEQEDSNA